MDNIGDDIRAWDSKRAVEGCPHLDRLASALEASGGELASVPAAGELLDEFLDSGELNIVLRKELENLARGDSFVRPPAWERMVVYQSVEFSVTIERKMPRAPASLMINLPSAAEFRLCGNSGAAAANVYRLPETCDMSRLDKSVVLRCLRSTVLGPDNRAVSGATLDVVDIEVLSPIVLLTLSERRLQPYIWAFDRQTQEPLIVASPDQSYIRCITLMEMLADFPGTMVSTDLATEILQQYGRHERHFVRWKACQTLAKINLAAARPLIESLTRDPHQNVRSAAMKAAQRLAQLDMA